MNKLSTITEAAEIVGISVKTIQGWEEPGKVKKAKKYKRGQRVYEQDDIKKLIVFHLVILFS